MFPAGTPARRPGEGDLPVPPAPCPAGTWLPDTRTFGPGGRRFGATSLEQAKGGEYACAKKATTMRDRICAAMAGARSKRCSPGATRGACAMLA
jgi:hypothetical protein